MVLFFAFSFSTFAQENVDPELAKLAKSNTKDLTEFLQIDETAQADFYRLFYYKHNELSKATNDERKAVISNTILKKIEASLNPDQLKKLNNNKSLLEKLTH